MEDIMKILLLVIFLTGNAIGGRHQHQHYTPVSPQQSPFPFDDKSGFGWNRARREAPDTALVDYPFTVEFVPKNQPVTSRSGVPLVDYPFTIEYVMRRNPAYRPKASLNPSSISSSSSLISNLGSFQFQSTDQYHLLHGGWFRE
ncbi:unnamed protein product [Orchesella dallaii]|uniref:Uncharacterized protein n=1 Tax=Orchesella dallaii TaxID=48710 RepID=A0ABP1S2V2_9HEXA